MSHQQKLLTIPPTRTSHTFWTKAGDSIIAKFEEQLTNKARHINFDKFTDPDAQASLVDAVQACARKGEKAHPDILSALIVQRVALTQRISQI